MTKTIYILRHAQSPMIRGDDFDRPLSEKGLADMKALADKMVACGLAPEYCYCSPANRTRQTWKTLSQKAASLIIADFPDGLYNAPAGTLYETLKHTDDTYSSVMIVAHNPGVHNLAVFLTRRDDAAPLAMGYQPGTLTVLSFECERWDDIMPNGGTMQKFIAPAV